MGASAKRPRDRATHVFLLVENRLLRETLVRLLRKRTDVHVVGESSPTEAIGLPAPLCDVIVLDDLNTAAMLSASMPSSEEVQSAAGLVLIGMEEDEEGFMAAVRCGVTGYLLNDASASDVIAAIRATARGEAVCPGRLCLALFRSVVRTARQAPAETERASLRGLTIRQQQLIALVAKGLTNKEIASQLNLSEYTVKNHIHRIMKQMEAGSRHEVVETARACGFIGAL